MPSASQRIPPLVRPLISERAKRTLDLVEKFVNEDCIPADDIAEAQIGEGKQRWTTVPAVMEDLKLKAKSLGLWNMFLAKGHYKEGAGFTNLEYSFMCEQFGRSRTASEATNNSAPDTGNMELIAKYGSAEQKKQWLEPLLEGKIRSCYVMTEPNVASSDAKNVQLSIVKDSDHYVLNGEKWWISGAGYPTCKVYIVLGKTNPNHPDPYKQQSMIIVPAGSPGITVKRMMHVLGYDDAPHGHAHLIFKNVRIPASNLILGEGRGFEIMQGRMGPGRIHHAMRSIGAAERALDYLLARANASHKMAFGKKLSEHGVIIERIAQSRIDIDAARLIVLNAAAAIDAGDAKTALIEIAEAKVFVPKVALQVVDWAMQAFGGEGLSQDTPLAAMWGHLRTVRIVDGPDEVHLQQLGKRENRRAREVQLMIQKQLDETDRLFEKYRVARGVDREVPRANL
ncbi:hypothetical protein H2198_010599 [Neophaeococcomyces mojaviensis]|uniref:Uncharacterized protein n=1 Tax=Neophaeococcomyces mojaviensis TaxID=3383035 RepID=A0ACC2ZR83_9EURO|nr:hypothetical protein H2198_010599 [Knufia sp. JES_112]